MKIVAALPVRGLLDGKSRLQHTLPDMLRQALILAMLEHVVKAVVASGMVDEIVVISPDVSLLQYAKTFAAPLVALRQTNTGLIGGLWQATNWAREKDANGFIALNADLPLLDGKTVRAFVTSGMDSERVAVIAGDRHGFGTNGLFIRPVGSLPFCFGEESFVRHQAIAAERGIQSVLFHSTELGFDLDTPADLRHLALAHPHASYSLWQLAIHHRAMLSTFTSTPTSMTPEASL
jgi:2-phospho-L-lactate/phosphoenolpyruvate guanylyltransferase